MTIFIEFGTLGHSRFQDSELRMNAAQCTHSKQTAFELRRLKTKNVHCIWRFKAFTILERGTMIAVHPEVTNEMDELTTSRKLTLCTFSLYNMTGSLLKLCYPNARSVHKHIQDLRGELNYSSSDINIFAETRFSC